MSALQPRSIVIANFDDVRGGAKWTGPRSHVSASALALDIPHVLVAAGPQTSILRDAAATLCTIVPSSDGSALTEALLADETAMETLIAAVRDVASVELRFQVWTDSMERVVRHLRRAGVDLDERYVPSVSGRTVAFWNTKRGGREVMASIPDVAPLLPAAEFHASLTDLAATLTGGSGSALVLKPDASLGGNGVVILGAHETLEPATLATARRRASKGKGGTAAEPVAWVVEELIGSVETNVSPTADYRIDADGVVFLGIGLQVLEDGVAYSGVRALPTGAAYRAPCIDLGAQICAELARRGYRGPANVDFVVTADERIAVVEINVRQSAPLEVFVALRQLHGPDWESVGYLSALGLEVRQPERWGELELPGDVKSWADHVVVAPEDGDAGPSGRVRMLISSEAPSRIPGLRDVALQTLGVGKERLDESVDADEDVAVTSGEDDLRLQTTLARRMRGVASRFRQRYPLSTPEAVTGSYPIPTNWGGRPETKVLAWFASPGCAWSLAGGCTMCDFSADEESVTVADAAGAFADHLKTLDPGTRRMHLGPGGSFFDDREVPAELREEVLRQCAVLPSLRSVGLETRPSLVSLKKLMHTIDHLPETVRDLTLGFGLECLDPLVREVAINKGYNTNHIDRAIEVIEQANRSQLRVRVDFEVYVLLKPLFLTEQEAIDEALRTIKWSFGRGATTVAMFMNTIKRNTVQGYLAARPDLDPPYRYVAPYYRTAIEVLRELPEAARRATQVLGPQSGVMADGQPTGCDLCTPLMLGAIMGFNFTRDSAILEEAARSWCPCRVDWEQALQIEGRPLPNRIEHGIALLEAAFPSRNVPGTTVLNLGETTGAETKDTRQAS